MLFSHIEDVEIFQNKEDKSMEKYLKFDDQVTVLTKHKELQQYLQFRKENDVWVQPYIKETFLLCMAEPIHHSLF